MKLSPAGAVETTERESLMKITTVKGTNDYLPEEVLIRDYLQNKILEVYRSRGFMRISTPAIESAENLDKSEGGENLNLIFKILKRGDKLAEAMATGSESELSDMGLRYDLTLPLCRYYANNKAKLMSPAKCIQIDKVYRAERPQKGRLREFVQCDIDILGSESENCEIELMDTTAQALLAIGMKDFTIKVNDRKLLRSFLTAFGFDPANFDSICITMDKLDKIGVEGVAAELREKAFDEAATERLMQVISSGDLSLEKVTEIAEDKESAARVARIIETAKTLADGKYGIVYDITLIRGQGYYTGTVFEVESNEFRGAIAGGGRYDHLIGKFIGESVPAVGFSIGFERIFGILMAQGFAIPDAKRKIALFYDSDKFLDAARMAQTLREGYTVSMIERPKKLGKFLARIEEAGFDGYLVFGEGDEPKMFA